MSDPNSAASATETPGGDPTSTEVEKPAAVLRRILRSRWVTVPCRIVCGVVIVFVAAAVTQYLLTPWLRVQGESVNVELAIARLGGAILMAGAGLGVFALFTRLTEGRWPEALAPWPALKELPLGLALGYGLISMSVTLIAFLGGYYIDSIADREQWSLIVLKALSGAVVAGVLEEIVFRGILLRILGEAISPWWALGLTSLLFGAAHLGNPNATLLVGLGLAIQAGFLLGVPFLATQRLWLPIGIHMAWNFGQEAIFGGALSGNKIASILEARLTGPEFLSGGAFGVEGSVVSTIIGAVVAASMVVLMVRHSKKAQEQTSLPITEHANHLSGP